jgi:hypothetical protein
MWHAWEKGAVNTGLLWGKLRERNHFEDLGIDRRNGRIILKSIFRNRMGA